jgi:hypothetical protein
MERKIEIQRNILRSIIILATALIVLTFLNSCDEKPEVRDVVKFGNNDMIVISAEKDIESKDDYKYIYVVTDDSGFGYRLVTNKHLFNLGDTVTINKK